MIRLTTAAAISIFSLSLFACGNDRPASDASNANAASSTPESGVESNASNSPGDGLGTTIPNGGTADPSPGAPADSSVPTDMPGKSPKTGNSSGK